MIVCFPSPYVNHMDSNTWFDEVVKNKDRLKGDTLLMEGSVKCGNF